MAVGYVANKADIDSRAGAIALSLRNVMNDIHNFKLFLDSKIDGDLTALGYSSGDIATLRSAYNDLVKLAGIYDGTQTQTPAYDFRVFAKLLTGVA